MTDTSVNTRANEFDRSFDDRFSPSRPESGLDLAVDVYEERGSVIARMTLPRMNPDNLDVSVDEDTLRISGLRKEEKETKHKDYTNKEVLRESFSRVIDLPKTVDASKASAEYRDGVLQVTMPAAPRTKEKAVRVDIKK